eukprot:s6257_g6.t1
MADTTDAGADQVARRRHMMSAVADLNGFFYLDVNCALHQFHLMVKDNLQILENFLGSLPACFSQGFEAYTSNLAKCANFWRTHVSHFIDSWEAIHGPSKASDRTKPEPVAYRRFPLQVISGRWGSIESCESFFIERSRELLEPVFLSVLSKYMKAAGTKKKPKKMAKESKEDGAAAAAGSSADKPDQQQKPGADLLDQAEEREAYRLKLSKWADGALKTIKSPLFWLFLHVGSQARSPLSMFFAWAQKNSDKRLIQQLVTGRAQEFQEEFDKLIQTFSTWFAAAVKDAGAEGLPAELMNLARTLAFKLVVHASASFSMRVTTQMQRRMMLNICRHFAVARYPYKLFWMLKRHPFSRCSERQRIAQEILDSASELLESNCRKLKFLYLSELRFVAKEGRFDQSASEQGSRLYAVISTMSELLKGDTQLVESINSIIRLISTRCPSIDLETLSARITVKKALTPELPASGKGKGYANKRWSVVSSHAKPLLMELSLGGTAYKQTLDNVERFSQPMRTNMPALESTLQNTDLSRALPDIRRTPQKQWVSSQATKLKASIEAARRESARLKAFAPLRPACLTVFCIRRAADHQNQDFYLQLLTYRSLLLVVRLKCEADGSLRLPQRSGTATWYRNN